MTKKYSKQHKVKEFLVGENESLRIPRIHRTCSDMLRLHCVIVQITGEHHSLYCLDAVQVYFRGAIVHNHDQAKMRTHLIHCFETQSMTPFSSHGSRRPSDPNIEAYSCLPND